MARRDGRSDGFDLRIDLEDVHLAPDEDAGPAEAAEGLGWIVAGQPVAYVYPIWCISSLRRRPALDIHRAPAGAGHPRRTALDIHRVGWLWTSTGRLWTRTALDIHRAPAGSGYSRVLDIHAGASSLRASSRGVSAHGFNTWTSRSCLDIHLGAIALHRAYTRIRGGYP
jgi:hypothetical protein